MDLRTRAATYEDLRTVAELLERHGVEYAIIGGYALALQGIVRLTEDIDVLVRPTEDNAVRWVRALSELPDHAASALIGDCTLHQELVAIRVNDEFTIDIWNRINSHSWDELTPYMVVVEGIRLISLEGLYLMKKDGRLKDQADAEQIRRLLER